MSRFLATSIVTLVLLFGTACQHIGDVANTLVPPVAIELGDEGIVIDTKGLVGVFSTSFMCLRPDGPVATTLTGLPYFFGDIGGFVVNDLIGACSVPEESPAPVSIEAL